MKINMDASKVKKVLKRITKIFLWIIGIPIILLLLVILILQFPATQKYITTKATTYISDKIKSKVTLGAIKISFPKSVVLEQLYVEDLHHDTLLYSNLLKVDLNLWNLMSHKIRLNSVTINGLTANVHHEFPDTTFNYSFIIAAFSSPVKDTITVEDTTSTPWEFSINKVNLDDIKLSYHDTIGGLNADINLGHFKTNFDVFDLTNKKILIESILLEKATTSIVQFKPAIKKETVSEPVEYEIGLGQLKASELNLIYSDFISSTVLNANVGSLLLELKKVDLKNETIAGENLELNDSKISYSLNKSIAAEAVILSVDGKPVIAAEIKSNWVVTMDKLLFNNNEFYFRDNNLAPLSKGFDVNNIAAKKINININDIYFNAGKILLDLRQLSFEEQSGLVLKNFKTKLSYDSVHVELANLDLETSNSRIRNYLSIKYSSLKSIADSLGKLEMNIDLDQTRIAMSDVLLFSPDLLNDTLFANNSKTIININTKVKGNIDFLRIEKLEIATHKNTIIKLNGIVKSVLDPNKMYADIKSFELRTTQEDIFSTILPKVLPQNITIPPAISLKGAFTGFVKNFDAELNAKTSFGDIATKLKLKPAVGTKEQEYVGKINIIGFDFGKLLKQEKNIGKVTMKADIKGSGLDTNSIAAVINATVEKAVLKGYEYKNLILEGEIKKQAIVLQSSIKDSNIVFSFNGDFDFDPNHLKYKFIFDLEGVDMKQLHLTDEDLRIRFLVQSDMQGIAGENIAGKASIRKILLIRNKDKYIIDSVVLVSATLDSISEISLTSEIISANMKGILVLKELPELLKTHFNKYFTLPKDSVASNLKRQKFEFEINLIDPTMLADNLIPGLEILTPSNVKGRFDSDAKLAELELRIPQIIYTGIIIDSVKIDIKSDNKKLDYSFEVAELSNPTVKFENVFFGGVIQDNLLKFQFNTTKDDSAKILAIGGEIKSIEEDFELKLNEEIILNKEKWMMDKLNYLHFGKNGLIANHLNLQNSNQIINISSKEQKEDAPLEIKFTGFEMATLSRIIENKTELVRGKIDGTVIMTKQNSHSAFTSDLKISNVSFQSHPIGDISLAASNSQSADQINVLLKIVGNENNISMDGKYDMASTTNNLNFLVDIQALNLNSFEPFLFGAVTRLSGTMQGKLNIRGIPTTPDINGTLAIKNGALNPTIIDSYLKIEPTQITLSGNKIQFNGMTLIDSLNNKAVVNGYMDIKDFTDIKFDLNVKTNNFLALNTTKEDNPLYFGTVYLNSDIKIKGTAEKPVINLTARINKGTLITYVTPIDQVNRSESEGIVVFVDTVYTNKTIMNRKQNDQTKSKALGITLAAKISFDRSAELRMLVDPVSGDSVYVKGSGVLDFRIDPNGTMTLVGKYSINDGGYHLSINEFVKRDFKIEKGSSISWSGDVMDAYVDLSAVYETRTAPLNLVQDELAGMDEFQKNKYRTLQKFLVYLRMHGFITAPEISFDIQLPPGDRGVLNGVLNSKLSALRSDENQLNKQVFALLTLNRFIGQDPLDNANQGGISSASRTSASRVLTQQLSNLSAKYVKGVDLNLGVNSFDDYSSGQQAGRTQLQIGVSKQLWNDKVTIQVGGNVELEGEKAKQNNASDIAGNISVEYKLTDDGRYRIKVYRETQYENPIEGELTKSAAGILFKRDFTTLKELFSKSQRKANKKTKTKRKVVEE